MKSLEYITMGLLYLLYTITVRAIEVLFLQDLNSNTIYRDLFLFDLNRLILFILFASLYIVIRSRFQFQSTNTFNFKYFFRLHLFFLLIAAGYRFLYFFILPDILGYTHSFPLEYSPLQLIIDHLLLGAPYLLVFVFFIYSINNITVGSDEISEPDRFSVQSLVTIGIFFFLLDFIQLVIFGGIILLDRLVDLIIQPYDIYLYYLLTIWAYYFMFLGITKIFQFANGDSVIELTTKKVLMIFSISFIAQIVYLIVDIIAYQIGNTLDLLEENGIFYIDLYLIGIGSRISFNPDFIFYTSMAVILSAIINSIIFIFFFIAVLQNKYQTTRNDKIQYPVENYTV